MKRYIPSDDPLAALVSIPSPNEENSSGKENPGYSREFQAMLDSLEEEDFAEEGRSPSEKKRRLTLHQVKALEKNFELENKLEPEKKLKLAEDLGLQPRQVAIWFQNRRARWKTKQLERDYSSLKASYDALQLDYSSLEQENEALTQQLKELKSKVGEEINADSSSQSAKEDFTASESENNVSVQSQHQHHHHHLGFSDKNEPVKAHTNTASPVVNWIQLSDSRAILGNNGCQIYQPHLVKIEDHGIFSAEESCNFFSVDQAPTLHWYFPDQ